MAGDVKLTAKQRKLVSLVADHMFGMDHDDEQLDEFCEANLRQDTFNACHETGLLHTVHDFSSGVSIVSVTESGRAALEAKP